MQHVHEGRRNTQSLVYYILYQNNPFQLILGKYAAQIDHWLMIILVFSDVVHFTLCETVIPSGVNPSQFLKKIFSTHFLEEQGIYNDGISRLLCCQEVYGQDGQTFFTVKQNKIVGEKNEDEEAKALVHQSLEPKPQ